MLSFIVLEATQLPPHFRLALDSGHLLLWQGSGKRLHILNSLMLLHRESFQTLASQCFRFLVLLLVRLCNLIGFILFFLLFVPQHLVHKRGDSLEFLSANSAFVCPHEGRGTHENCTMISLV